MESHTLAGYCGLFCESCTAYIGTAEDPARLQKLAARSGISIEDFQCKGCRSDALSYYCKSCAMKKCITEKGLDFCSACGEYPCDILIEFQSKMPHRLELLESLDYIKANGYESWLDKMKRDYTCSTCGAINSSYDFSCRGCGNSPSNGFVKRNGAKIMEALQNRK